MHELRHRLTIRFLKETLPAGSSVLDLGEANALSRLIAAETYRVSNTDGRDLDYFPEQAAPYADAVTAFEILEHLVNPFGVLRAIRAPRLFATVPLALWFAPAYWNEADPRDRHYHEFESRQFDMLLEKTGWRIVRSDRWTIPPRTLGLRPLLRRFTPRYYAVEARRLSADEAPSVAPNAKP